MARSLVDVLDAHLPRESCSALVEFALARGPAITESTPARRLARDQLLAAADALHALCDVGLPAHESAQAVNLHAGLLAAARIVDAA